MGGVFWIQGEPSVDLAIVLRPQGDVVRRDGDDDPAGGVLSGAPDRFVLRLRRSATPAEATTVSPRPGAL